MFIAHIDVELECGECGETLEATLVRGTTSRRVYAVSRCERCHEEVEEQIAMAEHDMAETVHQVRHSAHVAQREAREKVRRAEDNARVREWERSAGR
jgi:predicted RNA-binding Zn-ribbon protein involved in translation (DUF1610 family)